MNDWICPACINDAIEKKEKLVDEPYGLRYPDELGAIVSLCPHHSDGREFLKELDLALIRTANQFFEELSLKENKNE